MNNKNIDSKIRVNNDNLKFFNGNKDFLGKTLDVSLFLNSEEIKLSVFDNDKEILETYDAKLIEKIFNYSFRVDGMVLKFVNDISDLRVSKGMVYFKGDAYSIYGFEDYYVNFIAHERSIDVFRATVNDKTISIPIKESLILKIL